MKHFPIFLNLEGRRVAVSGGGEAAVAKLRLLLKSEARITVLSETPHSEILSFASNNRLKLVERKFGHGDAICAALVYAANEDKTEDARVAEIARAEGALVNIVDNLRDSAFITPAIVDRDPVTVAIGTEGAAPVLARAIKKDLEERLPAKLGIWARVGKAFRPFAEKLPFGRARRDFWSDYYFGDGQRFDEPQQALDVLLNKHLNAEEKEGHVAFVGAGPGDPDLMTLKARKALDTADVVIHDKLVTPEILELARREAILVDVGKTGFGPSAVQSDINELLIEHAQGGAQVVRLKSGDPTVFGRLDEEIDALDDAGIAYSIVPGITAASASVASLGQSLTKRGRNSGVRILTGHDVKGFADHDWRDLARPGEVAAIYMGKRAARFIQGRLMMHGCDPETPVSVVENASRQDQRIVASHVGALSDALTKSDLTGPALMLIGLSPRETENVTPELTEEIA